MERDRQTDRLADRQAGRQAGRHTDRQVEIHRPVSQKEEQEGKARKRAIRQLHTGRPNHSKKLHSGEREWRGGGPGGRGGGR